MMMLSIHRGRSIKHAVKLMVTMASTGVMRITLASLLIEVWDDLHLVPVVLYIGQQGFEITVLNEPQNPTINFQLRELDCILDRYGDNDPVRFLFDPDEHFAHIDFDVLRSLGATMANPHQMRLAQYDVTDMVTFWMHPQWIQEILMKSWVQQTRSVLTVFSHTDLSQPLPPDFQLPPGLPQWKYSMAFYGNKYLCVANGMSICAGFHTGMYPFSDEYKTPVLTFMLDEFSLLDFILPFESAALPQVTWTILLGN